MTCPRCSADNAADALDCASCGVVFAKWRPPRPATDGHGSVAPTRPAALPTPPWALRNPPEPPPPETLGITHAGWRAAAIGLGMAFVLTFFPFLSFILSPIAIMVHEIGHTVVLWLFGYPAIPAFDFANGGGVTMSDLERSPSAVWAWAIGLIALGWWKRENTKALMALGALALIYFWMYNSVRETLAITLGGHAGEIAFGALFLAWEIAAKPWLIAEIRPSICFATPVTSIRSRAAAMAAASATGFASSANTGERDIRRPKKPARSETLAFMTSLLQNRKRRSK